ncbi:MAG TPA: thiamine pyrophosphate-binding protein [Polyangiaceae bacterium]|nr:thiamine pyrophosphate-binding protein [Polyangiaceae bacterium]
MKLVDALVDALIALDVGYVFGVSGANIEHVHDAIHRRGRRRIESVLTRSEVGAAFMADARARVHRTLGVCCATSGGGMMNLAVGVAESYAESVPLLALIGQPPLSLAGRGAFQDSSGIGRSVNAVALFGAMTKYTHLLTRPEDFWRALTQAVVAACSDRKGPSALLIPRDLYEAEVPAGSPEEVAQAAQAAARPGPVHRSTAKAVLDEVRAARRPVLIYGQGVRRSSDPAAVGDFARALRIPVATTMSARGEFPNDDLLYLGMVGAAGHPSVHDYLRERADLLIVAGAGMDVMSRGPLSSQADLGGKRIVAVTVDPGELERGLAPYRSDGSPPMRVLRADAGVAFRTLLELWGEAPFYKSPPRDYRRSYFAPSLAAPIDGGGPPSGMRGSLLQSDALAVLNAYTPRAGHIVYDAGNCAAAALHYLDVEPSVSSTIALGMGGMGYAIAGAVGAQLGSPPGTRTVVFAGDGAFLMTGFEVHTAVDLRLPVLFVVFNNNMHGMCAIRQQLLFESRFECVRYAALDVAGVARGLAGPDALWVGAAQSVRELHRCVEDYFASASDRPGVLELRIAQEEMPPFVPFLPKHAPRIDRLRPSILPSDVVEPAEGQDKGARGVPRVRVV